MRVPDDRTLIFGEESIDLAGVEQVVSRAQMRAIGQGLALVAERNPGVVDVATALDAIDDLIEGADLDVLDPRGVGDLAAFRRFELAAALNRLRTLRVE